MRECLVCVCVCVYVCVSLIQPHPFEPVLATSGIESVITLWGVGAQMRSPLATVTRAVWSDASDVRRIVDENEQRQNLGPQVNMCTVLHALHTSKCSSATCSAWG